MHTLSRDQLHRVIQHIRQARPHPALEPELVDHMATLIERQMSQGQDFAAAFDKLAGQTSPQALRVLSQHYDRTFMPPVSRFNRRLKRRPATKPFYYMFFSSGLTLLLMGGFLVVITRPLALSSGVFHPTWAIALAALGAVGLTQWWLLKRRSPKSLAKSGYR